MLIDFRCLSETAAVKERKGEPQEAGFLLCVEE